MPTHHQAASGALASIATDMYAAVASGQAWHHRILRNGLELVLQRRDQQWRLALGRDGVQPSDVEVETVCKAFDVPAAVEQLRTQVLRTMPKTNRRAIYHVVELYWVEREKATATAV